MPHHILAHEFAEDLSGRLVLRPADFQERIPEIAVHANAEPCVLHWHGPSVANGYTIENSKLTSNVSAF